MPEEATTKITKDVRFDFINKFDLKKNNLILIVPAYEIKEDYDLPTEEVAKTVATKNNNRFRNIFKN